MWDGCFKHFLYTTYFNTVPNDKTLRESNFKAFADNKLDEIQIIEFVSGRVRKQCGERKNDNYHHFLLVLQCF